jgi:WD40 repeat protein
MKPPILDPGFDQRIADFLEGDPGGAPDPVLETVLAAFPSIPQRRAARAPWRLHPMTVPLRLVAAAIAIALVAVSGALILGTGGRSTVAGTPTPGASASRSPLPGQAIDSASASACPAERREVDAVDLTISSLTPSERRWGVDGGVPDRVRSGPIAAFTADPADAPLSVITIDPTTASRCRLVRFAESWAVQGPDVTALEWSPAGDALAISLGGIDGSGPGQVRLWTTQRLVRIWSGDQTTPRMAWAPDGRSIVVWAPDGGEPRSARLLHADGSSDVDLGVPPAPWSRIEWSPDGTRLVTAQAHDSAGGQPSRVMIVGARTGLGSELALPSGWYRPIGWLDDDRLVIDDFTTCCARQTRYIDVAISDPSRITVLPVPAADVGSSAVLSPDRTRLAYVDPRPVHTSDRVGDLAVITSTAGAWGTPMFPAPSREVGALGLAWSPDGTQLMFPADSDGLWTVGVDGTGLRRVAGNDVSAVDDPWQPVPAR